MDLDVIWGQIDTSKPPLNYGEFRTGLTFEQVYYLIWSRDNKRRRGVLGKWHELKQAMYREYLAMYETQKKNPCPF